MINDQYSTAPASARRIAWGPLFPSSQRNEVAALFSIEGLSGGNTALQYLATFEPVVDGPDKPAARHFRLMTLVQVGESGWRLFESVEIIEHHISLRGSQWIPGDKNCCPSKGIATTYEMTSAGTSVISTSEVR